MEEIIKKLVDLGFEVAFDKIGNLYCAATQFNTRTEEYDYEYCKDNLLSALEELHRVICIDMEID